MKYKIIVDKQTRTNPSSEKKEYIIDIEELRCQGNVYDSLIITKDEDYVMRRLSLSEYQALKVLDEPVKEPIPSLNIELFEGDNYIYLEDMVGNKFYAEYLIKNDFNEIYATRNEMNSAINQTAQQIELTVNQKLTGYSTTEEMNSAIEMKADSITSTVNKKFENYSTTTEMNSAITQKANSITSTVSATYATKNELSTAKTEIKQTTDSITSTVSKKVGNDEIISKINQSAEAVGINANKIELSANDILNLLAGNTINMTSKNIVISSTNFNVDKNGKVTCSDISITKGKILLEDGDKNNANLTIVNSSNNSIATKVCPGHVYVPTSSGGVTVNNINNASSHVLVYADDTGGGITIGGNASNDISLRAGDSPRIRCIGDIYANVYNYNSKEELKKNISKLNINALEVIKNADVYEFNYKTEKDIEKKHSGFIIGENYNTPKEIINEEENGIDAYSMCSILWKAVQELTQRLEKLEAIINEKN